MPFSSPLFLFLFLPVVLAVHFALRSIGVRNLWLLLVSVVFYAWGEPVFTLLMLASILLNHLCGILVASGPEKSRKRVMVVAAAGNLAFIAFFKYANFFVANANALFSRLGLPLIEMSPVHLPVGISFFTFQALSYVVDVYRRETAVQKNPLKVGLYIFFFPQLIAGPIVRYHDIAREINRRFITRPGFAYGVRRFILGLSKKVLIANTVAGPADAIFALRTSDLSPGLAWFALVCYSVQIYFDFSGYSDMAIGMGRMFGFHFLENFNYPYVSQSIREFWRRWHISLSTWFRDYLYIPLGGNRGSRLRTSLNLMTVFLLCGFWHGAAWTFIAWGLFHGVFLSLERTGFGRLMDAAPRPLRHLYSLAVVAFGWVLFRAENLSRALGFMSALVGRTHGEAAPAVAMHASREVLTMLAAGIVLSAPLAPVMARVQMAWLVSRKRPAAVSAGVLALETAMLVGMFVASAAYLAAGTYNPFIYFRF
jgi:alginate O-acetyltransferase complex protein AlgI